MKVMNISSTSRRQPYRFLLSLGIGIGSMAVGMRAHASVPTEGCSVVPTAATVNFSTVQVSKELEYLRRLDLHDSLGFDNNRLLMATCSATCTADGGGTYTQEPGCTYTQTCGGRPKLQG